MAEDYLIDIGTPVSQYSKVLVRGKAGYSPYTFFTLNGQTYSVDFTSSANFNSSASFQDASFNDEVEFVAGVYFYDFMEIDGNTFDSVSTGLTNNNYLVTKGYVDNDLYSNLVTKTASYTATLTDNVIIVDATSNDVTITLPLASTATKKKYSIKRVDSSSYTVTIDGNGTETIDDNTTITLTRYNSYTIICNGTEWWVI